MKPIKLLTALVITFLATASQAALITETWQSTVTSSDSASVNIGDVFSFSFTFDDSSTQMVRTWDNGAPDEVLCLYTGPDCTSTSYSDLGYSLLSDLVSYDISSLYDLMLGDITGDLDDVFAFNNAWRLTRTAPSDVDSLEIRDDHLLFNLRTDSAPSMMTIFALDENGGSTVQLYVQMTSALISTVPATSTVPEPAPLALLGLGLLGLSLSRKLKHRKSI